MLNDFVNKNGALYCGETIDGIVDPIGRRLTEAQDDEDTIVIFLCDAHDPEDAEFERFPKHAVGDTWGAEIIPELDPPDGEAWVLYKTRYSGFYGTNLDALLDLYCIEEATVVGCCTSICVMDTVGGLANRDIEVTIPKDSVADFDPEMHEMALKRMKNLYGVKIV
jgi:nicotinamidase-related amidase